MVSIQRSPALNVYIDGRLLPNVTGARVTRGFDQEMSTAQVSLAGNAPAWVKQGSQVAIRMGGTIPTAYQRFFGYVSPFGSVLWTPSDTLDCGDALLYAKEFKPSADVNLDGKTDQQIITIVFQAMGVPDALLSGIGGTGKIFSDDPDTPLVWSRNMTALSVIQEVDQASLGWKTWVDAGGAVRRTEVIELPTADPAFTFTEGVDILSGSSRFEPPEPNNEVTVTGSGGVESTVDDGGANTMARHVNPFPLALPMLRYQETSATALSTQEVAEWLLEHLNQNLVTVNFVTFRDELLSPDMTILTDASHLRLHTLFWLQNVVTEVTQQGQFRQQVQLVSSRDLVDLGGDGPGPVTVVDPFTGAPLPAPAPPVLPPGTTVEVSFSLAPIDKERVIIDGSEVDLFTVQATDTTAPGSGTVATRAWTATGPGVRVPSGDQPDFVTGFTDLAGAKIRLDIVDTLGNTGFYERPLDDGGGAPIKVKKLYAVAGTVGAGAEMVAFDGAVWRSQAPSGGETVRAVASGPWWACGALVYHSTDDLATPATGVLVFSGGEVITCIWKHETDEGLLAVGGSAGSLGISTDGGATWTLPQDHPPPNPGSVIPIVKRFIILAISNANQVHSVTNEGWFIEQDISPPGYQFEEVRLGDFIYIELSHTRNVVIEAAGVLQRGEDGTPFTGNTSPLVAATAHIRQDKFYALAEDGTTWIQDDEGSYALVAGVTLPDSAIPAPHGTYRDGEIVDLVYVATNVGIYKTLDGFRTEDGIVKLRDGPHILVRAGIMTDAPVEPPPPPPPDPPEGWVLVQFSQNWIDSPHVWFQDRPEGYVGGWDNQGEWEYWADPGPLPHDQDLGLYWYDQGTWASMGHSPGGGPVTSDPPSTPPPPPDSF